MANVTYSFDGLYSNNDFVLTVPDYLTVDTDVAPSAMVSCQTADLACANVHFFQDARAAGLTFQSDVEAIGFSNTSGLTTYYYFAAPAFATSGIYYSVLSGNPAILTISSVPEPANSLSWLAGLGLVGAATARRRKA